MLSIVQAAARARATTLDGNNLRAAVADTHPGMPRDHQQIVWSIATAMKYPEVRQAVNAIIEAGEEPIFNAPITEHDRLVMEVERVHFHGYQPAQVFSITYLEHSGDHEDPSYTCCCTEYYAITDRATAEAAFRERLVTCLTNPGAYGASSKARPIDAIFTKV